MNQDSTTGGTRRTRSGLVVPNGTTRQGKPGTAGTSRGDGTVAGFVLRACRESLGLTREQLAVQLNFDMDTVKSWELAKRPLAGAPGKTLRKIRMNLQRFGVDPALLRVFNTALDADLIIDQAFNEPDPRQWELGSLVTTRALVELVSWPITGEPPRDIRHAIPASTSLPTLGAGERDTFLARLAEAAEDRSATSLLRRQACFIAGTNPAARSWIVNTDAAPSAEWPSNWATERSLAVAQAVQGDSSRLRTFLRDRLNDDAGVSANITYWAYWIGNEDHHVDDTFMANPAGLDRLPLHQLLHQLTQGLHPGNPYVDLSVATVAHLLQRWPALLTDETARMLTEKTARMLDHDTIDHPPTRRALDQIQFAATMKRGG